MKKKLTEIELAKQVIKELENKDKIFSGICIILHILIPSNHNVTNPLEKYLPKLYKHLSKRRNFHYLNFVGCIGRKMGVGEHYYLWKPYNSTPRIKILKQVYNIK